MPPGAARDARRWCKRQERTSGAMVTAALCSAVRCESGPFSADLPDFSPFCGSFWRLLPRFDGKRILGLPLSPLNEGSGLSHAANRAGFGLPGGPLRVPASAVLVPETGPFDTALQTGARSASRLMSPTAFQATRAAAAASVSAPQGGLRPCAPHSAA